MKVSNRTGAALAVACAVLALSLVAACSSGTPATTPTTPATPAPPATSGSSTTPATGGATVAEANFAFDPTSVTVKVGDTVTFTNKDSAAHDVKIDGQDLGNQPAGATVTWKATKAGTFPFVCTIHPSMTGQVTVQ